jgi:phospho-N-acetylmuramoyl-pentapeptide-transferase
MLHALLGSLGLDSIRYISIRSAGAVLTAFLLCLIFGRRVIDALSRSRLGERTDKTGSGRLAELHEGKRGTPTMGGLLLCGSLLVSFVLWTRLDNHHALLAIAVLIGFAAVGFADDWVKLKDPDRHGLSARWKFWPLMVLAAAVGVGLFWISLRNDSPEQVRLYFPVAFLKDVSLPLDWPIGLPFVVVAILVLTGTSNAVNLTDGMDGLASGCVALAGLAFAGITYLAGHARLAEYLDILYVPGSGEMTVLCASLVGATLGFLWFNAAPAQVFMGDVGSLPIGGCLGYAALVSRMELVLLVVGGVFVAEALSVMVQVAYFKRTGRRVLRCAPLHHHFQFAGMPETRIVARFWIAAGLLALTSLAILR